GVVAIFALQMLRDERPTIFGDGSKTRDYVYIDDIVAANILFLHKGDGETLNLGWGEPVSDFRIFEAVGKAVGYSESPKYAPVRNGEVMQIALDATRASARHGWRPTVPLEKGIERTVEHIRQSNACPANS